MRNYGFLKYLAMGFAIGLLAFVFAGNETLEGYLWTVGWMAIVPGIGILFKITDMTAALLIVAAMVFFVFDLGVTDYLDDKETVAIIISNVIGAIGADPDTLDLEEAVVVLYIFSAVILLLML